MTEVTINLPEEAFLNSKRTPEEFVRDLRLAAAMFWYRKGEISQEKGAQIAGLNRRDFLEELATEKIDVFQVDFDDLEGELERD